MVGWIGYGVARYGKVHLAISLNAKERAPRSGSLCHNVSARCKTLRIESFDSRY